MSLDAVFIALGLGLFAVLALGARARTRRDRAAERARRANLEVTR